jgi:hypothetical protein
MGINSLEVSELLASEYGRMLMLLTLKKQYLKNPQSCNKTVIITGYL